MCPLGSPAPLGCWPDLGSCSSLTSVRRPPAAAPNVAHCLPVAHKHSPDGSSSIYCCDSLSSGGRVGAVISSKAEAVGVERMGCQSGRHPSRRGPNVSPLRFSIWQGSSSPEVIPELSSPCPELLHKISFPIRDYNFFPTILILMLHLKTTFHSIEVTDGHHPIAVATVQYRK